MSLSAEQAAVLDRARYGESLLIVGSAGTGKSFLVSRLSEELPAAVVTAMTGAAAVLVNGTTIHSFLGLGCCDKPAHTIAKALPAEKREAIRKAKTLIVDECSMTDVGTAELIDGVLRKVRNCMAETWGGLQMIFVGDMHQIKPVCGLPFYTNSDLMGSLSTVRLEHNFRQCKDPVYAGLLGRVATASCTPEDVALIETRVGIPVPEDVTRLYGRNVDVDGINNKRLCRITKAPAIYKVHVEDNLKLSDSTYRKFTHSPGHVSVAPGAYVRVTFNIDLDQGLANGTCGHVVACEADHVRLRLLDGTTRRVGYIFKHVPYGKRTITVRYLPIRLAWAGTVHNAQGATLGNVFASIDFGTCFEEGMAYVILSRVQSLSNLYLARFNPKAIRVYRPALVFSSTINKKELVVKQLLELIDDRSRVPGQAVAESPMCATVESARTDTGVSLGKFIWLVRKAIVDVEAAY